MSKQVFFFGDVTDLTSIASEVESHLNIIYHNSGLLEKEDLNSFNSYMEIGAFGVCRFGDWNLNSIFLILPSNKKIEIREVLQKNGEMRYAIDQMENDKSVSLFLGGEFENKTIIASKVSTIHNDETSKELMKIFSKAIRKKAKKVGSFYVCPGAMEKRKRGWRLTESVQSPEEYDLKCP